MRKLPPQDSPFAFSSSTPSMVACGLHGELGRGLDEPLLERRGGGHDLEGRARAAGEPRTRCRRGRGSRRCAGRARRCRRSRPASADHGRLLEAGVDRGPHRLRRRAAARGRARGVPAQQLAAGPAAQALLERLLEAALAHRPVAAGSRARRAPPRSSARLLGLHAPGDRVGDRPRAARSVRPAGPSASTLPSRDRSVARSGGALSRVRRSPVAQLGEHQPRLASPPARRSTGTSSSPRSLPNTRVSTTTGTATSPSRSPSGSPASMPVGWPWRPPGGRRAGSARSGHAALGRVAEQRVHAAQVAALPGRGEVAGHALGARARWLAPTTAPATSATPASPPRAGSARWVRRRRRSEVISFTGISGVGDRERRWYPRQPLALSPAVTPARLDHRRLHAPDGRLGLRRRG